MDDFRLSTNPIMAKAWKERLEPAMEMYGNEIGYGKLLFTVIDSSHTFHLSNKFIFRT